MGRRQACTYRGGHAWAALRALRGTAGGGAWRARGTDSGRIATTCPSPVRSPPRGGPRGRVGGSRVDAAAPPSGAGRGPAAVCHTDIPRAAARRDRETPGERGTPRRPGGARNRAGDVVDALTTAVAKALGSCFGPEFATRANAALRPATKKAFGDFQCNAALALAKRLPDKAPPRDVATKIAAALEADPAVRAVIATPLEIAGPGFVNMRLGDDYLAATVSAIADAPDAAVPAAAAPQNVVVDYSSPNIAKEMHVGAEAASRGRDDAAAARVRGRPRAGESEGRVAARPRAGDSEKSRRRRGRDVDIPRRRPLGRGAAAGESEGRSRRRRCRELDIPLR